MNFMITDLVVFFQVLLIDLALAGDNAVVIGLAVGRLEKKTRKKVIFWGVALAVILRILMALISVRLLEFKGLTFVGGLLLLWVSWHMLRETVLKKEEPQAAEEVLKKAPQTVKGAVLSILLADFSMSLDNVLAVAGAAREHPYILAIGLLLSVILMAFAADFVAKLLIRYKWIVWLALLIVFGVTVDMLWRGGREILPYLMTYL